MLTPLHDKLIVLPMFPPDTSPGGIIIPDNAQSRCNQGIVKCIGPEVTSVKPGDHILFTGYAGEIVRLESEGDLIMIPEKYVTGIIDDDNEFEIPGMYFYDKQANEYVTCNYTIALDLFTRALAESPNNLRVKEFKPSAKELYD